MFMIYKYVYSSDILWNSSYIITINLSCTINCVTQVKVTKFSLLYVLHELYRYSNKVSIHVLRSELHWKQHKHEPISWQRILHPSKVKDI